jgi:hypothetical protein
MRHNLNRRAVIAESLAEIDELPDQALTNRGEVTGNSPHIPLADTITAVLGVKLTAKASGLFVLYVHGLAAAAAAGDVVTWTVDTYTDAVVGTPLTLPGNAAPVGVNCVSDNSGAGIAPSAGATAAQVITADAVTLGTAAVGDKFMWGGIVTANNAAVPKGSTFYATLSITDSVAARAVTQASVSAYELP